MERLPYHLFNLNHHISVSGLCVALCWLKITGKETSRRASRARTEKISNKCCSFRSVFRRMKLSAYRLPSSHSLPTAVPVSWRRVKRFYDAIVTDPPYNIKAKVATSIDGPSREGRKSTSLRGTEEATKTEAVSSAFQAARPDSTLGIQHVQRKKADVGGGAGCVGDRDSEWKPGDGARAEARANDLVGEVIWSLLSLARYSLKPGGRLCFFLPLRGAEARLVRLPTALLERLSEGDCDGGGKRLSVVYATKQRMTSPNMCRWLVVMEKERQ